MEKNQQSSVGGCLAPLWLPKPRFAPLEKLHVTTYSSLLIAFWKEADMKAEEYYGSIESAEKEYPSTSNMEEVGLL